MNWMLMPLRRYADFQGRSRRKEYWMFTLGVFIVYLVLMLLSGGFAAMTNPTAAATGGGIFGIILIVFYLAILVPSIAVAVRRLHDQDKSGWFVLLGLIPLVGGIILLVFMCLDGTRGSNRFGADPKGADVAQVFS